MLFKFSFKGIMKSHVVQGHVCTLAMAMSFTSMWRAPDHAFDYGGITFCVALTIATVLVALPTSLLHLAVGQLNQEDAVGVWTAVPFFKGIGYIRLLITYVASVCTSIYVAETAFHFLNSINCSLYANETEVSSDSVIWINETFPSMETTSEEPEYYIASSLMIVLIWIVFPFLLHNPMKMMKRIFYALGPTVLLLIMVIVFYIGNINSIKEIYSAMDWWNYLEPNIWFTALVQSLWISQIAGGYLLTTGGTIYYWTNIHGTAIVFVAANVVANWAGILFWYAITGVGEPGASSVLAHIEMKEIGLIWQLTAYATLFLSGIITLLGLLYPLYDCFHRVGGQKWKFFYIGSSICGAAVSVAVFTSAATVIHLLEDIVLPFMICAATVLEILAYILIYGWKMLKSDVEFLTGRKINLFWVMGWFAAPCILIAFTTWWIVTLVLQEAAPLQSWEVITLALTAGLTLLLVLTTASGIVAKQVQYDFCGKLWSSFKPSRRWGPRDPITNHYWISRRENINAGDTPQIQYRRQMGQMLGRPSILDIPNQTPTYFIKEPTGVDTKRRNYSDDCVYTYYRKKYLEETVDRCFAEKKRRRVKSIDCGIIVRSHNSDCSITNFNIKQIRLKTIITTN